MAAGDLNVMPFNQPIDDWDMSAITNMSIESYLYHDVPCIGYVMLGGLAHAGTKVPDL